MRVKERNMPEILIIIGIIILGVLAILNAGDSSYKNSFRCAVPTVLLLIWLVAGSIHYNKEVNVEKVPVTIYVDTAGAKTFYYFSKNKNSLVNIFVGNNSNASRTDDNKSSIPEKQDYVYIVTYKNRFSYGIFMPLFMDNVDIYVSLDAEPYYKSLYESSKVEK